MTDARTDAAADRDGAPRETGSESGAAPENLPRSPDQDDPGAVPCPSARDDRARTDLTEVAGGSAAHEPASSQRSTGPADTDVTADVQADVALQVPPSAEGGTDLTDADLTRDVQAEPADHDPTLADPALADPALADPTLAEAGTESRSGRPEPDPVAAAPPLRDPDEAALRLAEAAVFASATPVTPRALSQILPDDLDPAAVITALRARYEGRGLELCEIGGGLQFRTAADLAPQLRKVVQVPRRLPRVALETLAIVAYHQPITRPEIEDLRGTGLSQQTLDVLLENDLIVARGRKETPGRPTLWGTTPKFLEYFGLRDIRELPRRQDLLLEAVRPETDQPPPVPPEEEVHPASQEEEAHPVPPESAQS